MQKPKYLILFLLCHFLNLTYAQDISNFTQFFFNPYTLNPSFAGTDGHSALFLTYRKQWSGIEGSPTIGNLSFHAPLKSGLSAGINVANDQRGLLSNSGMLFTLAYSVSFGEGKYMRFGLSGGGSWNTVDLDKIKNMQNFGSDPALVNLLNQSSSVIGNAGLSLHLKSFHIGAAIPNLFAPSYVSEDAFTVTEVKPFEAIILHASNRFYFADNKHVFEPYVVYRINNGLPTQYEVAGVVHLNHVVWLGGSYKEEFGISALGGFKLNKTFALGGSYTLKNSGANELSFPTYEIHLSLLGGASKSKSKTKSKASHPLPLYSFVHTEIPKKTRAEVIHDNYAAAIAKADKELAAKNYEAARIDYYEAQKYKPNESYPKTKIEEVGKIITYEADIKKANTELASKSYEQALADYEEASKLFPNEKYPLEKIAEIKALMAKESDATELERRYNEAITKADAAFNSKSYPSAKNYYTTASGLKPNESYPQERLKEIERLLAIKPVTEIVKETVKETPKVPVQEAVKEPVERHETFKRGTGPQELESGNYVIVGVFGSAPNAKNMARKLVDTGFNANYGYLTEKNLWYVYVFKGDDINKTRMERDHYRKMPLYKNAWLLTIQN